MSKEAEKTWNIWTDEEKNIILNGKGIDIGCGNSPIHPDCCKFDVEDGDANEITKYINEQFDYVFSSHCLEHMFDPYAALKEWWGLVRSGGTMIILVPDEDLYEQGMFPSQFNTDHKWTFTISKRKSWSSKSVNVLDLINSLDDVCSSKVELQDFNYDRSLLCFRKLTFFGRCLRSFKYRIVNKVNLEKYFPRLAKKLDGFFSHYFPIDQTSGNVLAQIQIILKKSNKNT